MNRRSFLALPCSAAVAAALAPLAVAAQTSASGRPLKIIVATPAGGASDTAARLLAQGITRNTGQVVVVENKPGGNGVPALLALLAAAPDGQTLLWATSSMTGMPLLVKSAPVRSLAELTPVAPVANLLFGLFVSPSVPANTLAEFTAYLKAHPDKLMYGTAVLSEYMAAAQFLHAAGAKAVRVPYKGGAQLMPDLISGQVQFNIGPLAPALPHVRSGRLRLLATVPDRVDAAADVPLLTDTAPEMATLPTWNALVAPPRTPPEAVGRIGQAVDKVLAEPALRTAFEAQGLRATGGSPRQLAEAIESATATWRQFIRDYDIPQE